MPVLRTAYKTLSDKIKHQQKINTAQEEENIGAQEGNYSN
jgi:hypothetical protein